MNTAHQKTVLVKERTIPAGTRLTVDTMEAVRKLAKDNDRTLSRQMKRLIERGLEAEHANTKQGEAA